MDYVGRTDRRRTSAVSESKKENTYVCLYVLSRTHRRVGGDATFSHSRRAENWKLAYQYIQSIVCVCICTYTRVTQQVRQEKNSWLISPPKI